MKKILLTAVALFMTAGCFAQSTGQITIREITYHTSENQELKPFYLRINGGPYVTSPAEAKAGDWITVSANPDSYAPQTGCIVVTEAGKSPEEMFPGLGQPIIFPAGESGQYIKCEFQVPYGSADLNIDVYSEIPE